MAGGGGTSPRRRRLAEGARLPGTRRADATAHLPTVVTSRGQGVPVSRQSLAPGRCALGSGPGGVVSDISDDAAPAIPGPSDHRGNADGRLAAGLSSGGIELWLWDLSGVDCVRRGRGAGSVDRIDRARDSAACGLAFAWRLVSAKPQAATWTATAD